MSYGDNYNYEFTVNTTIRDLVISSVGGGAILHLPSQSTSTTLVNVELGGPPNNVTGQSGAVGSCISVSGQLHATGVRIHDGVHGIDDEGGAILDQVEIYNDFNGILVGNIQQANIQATNLLMHDSQGSAFRAVNGIGTIAFSTFANSLSSGGTTGSAADCNHTGVAISNSVLWSTGTNPVTANCTITNSIAGPPGPDPQFVNLANKDYHLSVGSPAIDKASNGPASDLDGVARPQGTKWDWGAYEFKP